MTPADAVWQAGATVDVYYNRALDVLGIAMSTDDCKKEFAPLIIALIEAQERDFTHACSMGVVDL